MSKNKNGRVEVDDEFLAQVDFLRSDYDAATLQLKEQKEDILRLIARLVEHGIPIPEDILERYVKQDSDEDLPFK